jgi:hypothetical protein
MGSYERPDKTGSIVVHVSDDGVPFNGAVVSVYRAPEDLADREAFDASTWKCEHARLVTVATTNEKGVATIEGLPPGHYVVQYEHLPETRPECVEVEAGCAANLCLEVSLGAYLDTSFVTDDCQTIPCPLPRIGDRERVIVRFRGFKPTAAQIRVNPPADAIKAPSKTAGEPDTFFRTITRAGPQSSIWELLIAGRGPLPGSATPPPPASLSLVDELDATERVAQAIGGNLGVSLQRTATTFTSDLSHWQALINSTEALSFNTYFRFMDLLFCGIRDVSDLKKFEQDRFDLKEKRHQELLPRRVLPFIDSDAYRVVKVATEAFVMVNCGIMEPKPRPFDDARDRDFFARRDLPFPTNGLENVFGKDYLVPFAGGAPGTRTLPYLAVIRRKLSDIDIKLEGFDVTPTQASECFGILQEKLTNPCLIELIWSYWQEEGMLVQTTNAIARRFQNVRGHTMQDPLANLEIDPLRPLNNLLWGYVQDEQHRLSVVRRNYEYDHQYGLRLDGRAVQAMNPADTRSKFLEAFHNLLRLANTFFKQDDDTTVKADAFPVLNALKEVHLILTEGQHNQFGDLPSTARIEMLMQQWLLARPEFREFLPTRISVAYPEPWMDRVDAMKKLQGWTDTSVMHFRNLAIFGEQILLSIRWGFWSDVQEPLQAFNWLRAFRPQIQGYIHAYRAVAGVDLAAEVVDTQVDATMPSALLRRRLVAQQQQQRA